MPMEIEHSENLSQIRSWHIALLLIPIFLGILCLARRLWHVQVLDSPQYGAAQSAQSFRRVLVPGLRGKILDRNGIILADSRPAYAVVLYCEEHRQPGNWKNTILAVDTFIDNLANRLQLPREVDNRAVARHIRGSLPMPLILWKDVDYRTIAYLSERAQDLPGIAILPLPKRIYPNHTLASHLIGYVGAPREISNDSRKWHYRLPQFEGRAGIEARYNELLDGEEGEELLQVDSRGYTHHRWIRTPATPGKDIKLTIDANLQRAAEAALENRPGAVVAIDPRNGDILTLASAPTYDINEMVPPVLSDFYNTLLNNEDRPMINRAIQAQYAPGSIFKPFVALAAQEEGYNNQLLYDCTGIYTDYSCRLRCANRYGHGELDMCQALMKSCNPYFCYVGTEIGIQSILRVAQQAGFGELTGIDIGGEAKGFLPTPEWKQKRFNVAWHPVDTAQCAIGQGAITTTPLQMAHATATLAMRGIVYRPRLVANDPIGERLRTVPWDNEYLDIVFEGMEAVVTNGTGQTMQLQGVSVAGKTGTAEYMDKGVRRKHVWCIAFAPIEKPRIAICAMLDNGSGGGKDAGPIIQHVLATYFKTNAIDFEDDDEILQD